MRGLPLPLIRGLVLPLIAILLVAVVLGVEVAAGGGQYVPRRAANPCIQRAVPPIPARLEPLAERVVLLGLDNAACRLGISRERLVLELADAPSLGASAPAALKGGLHAAVDRLAREHRLPKVSQLLPEALAHAALPGLVKTLIEALPNGLVDNALPTGPLLRRTVDELDVNRLLRELNDPRQLEAAVQSAIQRAALRQILERLAP